MSNVVDTKAQFNFIDKDQVADFATLAVVLGADMKLTAHAETKSKVVELEWKDREVIHQIVGLVASLGLQKQKSTKDILAKVAELTSDYGFGPDVIVNPGLALENQKDSVKS